MPSSSHEDAAVRRTHGSVDGVEVSYWCTCAWKAEKACSALADWLKKSRESAPARLVAVSSSTANNTWSKTRGFWLVRKRSGTSAEGQRPAGRAGCGWTGAAGMW
ncbi:hypothetical protein GUJ93_ZPchr0008g11850 [Zizania palustris]|uniref:Uncharacterized protein n=1 Tax=Zizania palustris TaxID=103762 RepID=A0A8J5RP02_ZIZPA|nr:hypothetical protein GUJ93_ZPchr0008g11850 [Zizania palustris]